VCRWRPARLTVSTTSTALNRGIGRRPQHNSMRKLFILRIKCCDFSYYEQSSVANPDPDPHDFGPPGSGSISQRYGFGSVSGSGSFYHHAKIVRKTLIPTIL
jgi:hypothetical protein